MNDNTYLQSWAEKTSCFICQDSVQTDDETQGSVCTCTRREREVSKKLFPEKKE